MQLRTEQAGPSSPCPTLSKTYASGFHALEERQPRIRRGEIFALLGPNGAGKTTLISIVCGIVNAERRHGDGRRPRHRHATTAPRAR